jgi:hypothetical protein
MRPIRRVRHETVLDRVEMDVIHVGGEIATVVGPGDRPLIGLMVYSSPASARRSE